MLGLGPTHGKEACDVEQMLTLLLSVLDYLRMGCFLSSLFWACDGGTC